MKLRSVICVLSVLVAASTTVLAPGLAYGQEQGKSEAEPNRFQKLLKERDRTPDPDVPVNGGRQILDCIPGIDCEEAQPTARPGRKTGPALSTPGRRQPKAEAVKYCAKQEPVFPCWALFDTDETVSEPVYFESGSANLSAGARETWRGLGAELARGGVAKVRLVGHTDAIGSDSFNMALSKRRANAVRAVLREEMPGIRISAEGRGERELADPQNGGSAKNRRVVMEYLKTR